MSEPRFPTSVLVVDDEPIVLQIVSKALGSKKLSVKMAASAEEAEPLIASQFFGCLLLDKNLPGKNGIALLRMAREASPDSAVIIMTAYASVESAVEALRLGATDYLEKPFPDLELVAQKVERAIERKRIEYERNALLAELADFRDELDKKAQEVASARDEIALFNGLLEQRVRQASEDLRKEIAILQQTVERGADITYAIGVHTESLLEHIDSLNIKDAVARGALVRLRRRLEAHFDLVKHAVERQERAASGKA